ncbi:hypothetical protein DFJ74DRAFT_515358 [Hyaloraphidium curvatum]|nr:hypothetical protein DFJ74DRAFT_515358 [Hyaloraphidium curvatum]
MHRRRTASATRGDPAVCGFSEGTADRAGKHSRAAITPQAHATRLTATQSTEGSMFTPDEPPSGTVLLAMRCYSRIADRRGVPDELAFSADRVVPAHPAGADGAAWAQAVAAAAFECELPAGLRGDRVPCGRCGRVASILALEATRGEGAGGPLHVVLALAAPNCQREKCERAIGDAFAEKAGAFFDVPAADGGTPLFDISSLDHATRAASSSSMGDEEVIATMDSEPSFGVFAAKVTAGGPGPIALCFVRFLNLGASAEAPPATLSDYVLVQVVPDDIAAHAGTDTLAVESFVLEAASQQVDSWGVDELLRHTDLRCQHCGGACDYFLAREAAYPAPDPQPQGAFPVVAAVGVFVVLICASHELLLPGLPGLPESKEAALQCALSDGGRVLGRLAGCIPLIEQQYLREAGLCAFCLAGPPPGALPWLGCSSCRSVTYCCRDHQELDWTRHGAECQAEAKDPPRDREGFKRWLIREFC